MGMDKISIACGVEQVGAGPSGGLEMACLSLEWIVHLESQTSPTRPGVHAPGAVTVAMAIPVLVRPSYLAALRHVVVTG